MSTMWSTCSMSTGHCSTQAPQVVHDHSTSGSMTPPVAECRCASALGRADQRPLAPRRRRVPPAASASAASSAFSPPASRYGRLGERVVAQVHDQQLRRQRLARCSRPGTGDWQRPHSVQVAKSSRPFQVKSSTLPRPKTSSSAGSSKSIGRVPVVHRQQRAEGVRPAGEEHVERGQEDVQVLGVHDQAEEAEHHRDLQQDRDRLDHLVASTGSAARAGRPPTGEANAPESGTGSCRCRSAPRGRAAASRSR